MFVFIYFFKCTDNANNAVDRKHTCLLYLALVHVQSLRAQSQLPLCSTNGALQEALFLLQLPYNLQLSIHLNTQTDLY